MSYSNEVYHRAQYHISVNESSHAGIINREKVLERFARNDEMARMMYSVFNNVPSLDDNMPYTHLNMTFNSFTMRRVSEINKRNGHMKKGSKYIEAVYLHEPLNENEEMRETFTFPHRDPDQPKKSDEFVIALTDLPSMEKLLTKKLEEISMKPFIYPQSLSLPHSSRVETQLWHPEPHAQ